MGLSKILRNKVAGYTTEGGTASREGGTAGLTQWVRPQFKIQQEISLATNFARFLQVLGLRKSKQLAGEPTV
jgi:hypothetical protein